MPLKNGKTTADVQTILLGSVIPSGTIAPFGGGTVPAGWLLCDGSTVSRSTYSSLFDAIGTAHGAGNGSSTFHLPDYRGRFLRGADNMGTGAAGRDVDSATRTAANTGGNTTRGKGQVVMSEGFESGDFINGGWTVVNGSQTNKWIVGTATKNSGTYSAYISNNNTSNQYTSSSSTAVWIYKDITLSDNQFDMSFNYKLKGEVFGATPYDFLRVIIDPTRTVIPTAGSFANDIIGVPVGGSNTKFTDTNNIWQKGIISLNYPNQTVRIIFGWVNDSLGGTQPPVAIDNIEIYTLNSIGSVQSEATASHKHFTVVDSNTVGSAISSSNSLKRQAADAESGTGYAYNLRGLSSTPTVGNTSLTGGSETRPQNAAVAYIIKV